MESRYRVAIVGFSAFERATLGAFFRLTARRALRYELEPEATEADLLLVDSDLTNLADLTASMGLVPQRCVFIGSESPAGALLHLPRPLNMMVLLRRLDQRLTPDTAAAPPVKAAQRQAAASPAATSLLGPRAVPASASNWASFAPADPVIAVAPVGRIASAPASIAPEPSTPSLEDGEASSGLDDILVVDDSDIALRFMASVLGRYGFQVHLARSGEDALRRVAEQHFEFVFMDVNMPGMNGNQATKLIKKAHYQAGRRPPTVVMLTGKDAKADHMRGILAGCDAYLTKPLQSEQLMKIIGDRIVVEQTQDTVRDPN
jgi:two-component system, cell cycle response regulator